MSDKFYASSERDDWQTPTEVIDVVREIGSIHLDPCASKEPGDWFATGNINGVEASDDCPGVVDGLEADWRFLSAGGLTYCNPPYGGRRKVIDAWIAKCVKEARQGCEVVLLVPAATGSQWFCRIWDTAIGVCFVEGRLRFRISGQAETGCATFWSALCYWGADPERFEAATRNLGRTVFPSLSRFYACLATRPTKLESVPG